VQRILGSLRSIWWPNRRWYAAKWPCPDLSASSALSVLRHMPSALGAAKRGVGRGTGRCAGCFCIAHHSANSASACDRAHRRAPALDAHSPCAGCACAPILASRSASSLPGIPRCPGIHSTAAVPAGAAALALGLCCHAPAALPFAPWSPVTSGPGPGRTLPPPRSCYLARPRGCGPAVT